MKTRLLFRPSSVIEHVVNHRARDRALGTIRNMPSASDDAPFDYRAFLAKYSNGTAAARYEPGQIIYAQGDPADSVFYIVSGLAKVTVISEQGKEGVLAILRQGEFFGERCLAGQDLRRNVNTIAANQCEIIKSDCAVIQRALEDDANFVKFFLKMMLDRNRKTQDDLIDQLFFSSEKRLARILLSLADTNPRSDSNLISVPITQETLASMVGTTRSRISQFMTKFRKLGYIDYGDQIRVHHSLLNIILNERSPDIES
jgi:CRP-like cAMP-binding protein